MSSEMLQLLHRQMIEVIAVHTYYVRDKIGKDALDQKVLEVMARIPRHDFVPIEVAPFAYADQPLPIGFEKTISQPFMVALMTDLLEIESSHTVLEIGTGLGYHTSILASLAGHVYTVELIEELHQQAKRRLAARGFDNITMRLGSGEHGWPEHGPYDRIVVCAASELIPAALLRQLKPDGRMVVPTGLPESQTLLLVEKDASGRLKTKEILPVRFALMETEQG
jgi:protein-L-isoaspartate(D-aspartate) O-methyltransferase